MLISEGNDPESSSKPWTVIIVSVVVVLVILLLVGVAIFVRRYRSNNGMFDSIFISFSICVTIFMWHIHIHTYIAKEAEVAAFSPYYNWRAEKKWFLTTGSLQV